MKIKYIYTIILILILIGVLTFIFYPNEKRLCEKDGGKWEEINPNINECNLPTSDARKECYDSIECEGICIAELSDEDWEKAEGFESIYTNGKCTDWKRTAGCHAVVENGTVRGILCID